MPYPTAVPYFTVTFCKLICMQHFSVVYITHFFFSFRQEIRSSCFATVWCGYPISYINHQGRYILNLFPVYFEDLVVKLNPSCFDLLGKGKSSASL